MTGTRPLKLRLLLSLVSIDLRTLSLFQVFFFFAQRLSIHDRILSRLQFIMLPACQQSCQSTDVQDLLTIVIITIIALTS